MPTKYVVGICCVANVAAGNWEFDEASSTNLIAEGIDHSKPQILKVALIARCDLGTTGQGDACDQRVAQIHRCTPGFALGSKVGGFVSRQSIQGSDPALHQLPKKQLNTPQAGCASLLPEEWPARSAAQTPRRWATRSDREAAGQASELPLDLDGSASQQKLHWCRAGSRAEISRLCLMTLPSLDGFFESEACKQGRHARPQAGGRLRG